MLNQQRTKEIFGYEVTLERTRRSVNDIAHTNGVQPKKLNVVDNCPICGVERIIKLRQSRKNKPCSKCFHNTPIMIEIKQNQIKEKSAGTRQKMKENHWSKHGGIAAFKGKKHSNEVKEYLRKAYYKQFATYSDAIKRSFHERASCTIRGVSIDEFSGFITPENTKTRQSVEGKAWTYDVLVKFNFTCIKCSERGGALAAHHMNAFASYPEQRLDTENGACLCRDCHNEFHAIYGKGANTKEQFHKWINPASSPILYLLCGASGSGKSWVASQLTDKFTYVSFDGTPKKNHIELLHKATTGDKPILYDPTIKISTFIKRHSHEFNIQPVFIIESEEVVRGRIESRGGKWTDYILKRMKVMEQRNKKYGVYSGTSEEVLNWLQKV